MARQKRFSLEEIIAILREAEIRIRHGHRVGEICRHFGVSEQSYYRWRRNFGGLRIDQIKKMQNLEEENVKLRKFISSLAQADKFNFQKQE